MPFRTLPRALAASLLAAAGPFLLSALAQPNPTSQDHAEIREVVTPSGLKYIDLKLGQGDAADVGKVLEVRYSGWLANGVKFDSSIDDRPFTFRLGTGDAIKGWDEGLMGMRAGGKRRLVIPPELGFGKQGVGSVVPPNAVLVYEFELLAVR
jgi:FKBP-type peptidyl-prolyl cis-trans isomerase